MPQLRVTHQPGQGVDHPVEVLRVHDEAGGPVLDDGADTGHVRGHDGQPGQATLDEHARHTLALGAAGKDHHVGAAQQIGHVGSRAEHLDARGGGRALDDVAEGTVADEDGP